jgi:hypothetical protein
MISRGFKISENIRLATELKLGLFMRKTKL